MISDVATVDSTRAQVRTAETLYQQDVDRGKQGVIASIDVLRSQVELQTQQQRLIAAENQLAIDKLTLARVIGLPNGQEFQLTDSIPYLPLDNMTLDQALQEAHSNRPDYLSAKLQVQAAELALSVGSGRELSLPFHRHELRRHRHPQFRDFARNALFRRLDLTYRSFRAAKVRADKLQADSDLAQRKAELADLGGKIDAAGAHGLLQSEILVRSRSRGAEQYRSRQPDADAGAGPLCGGSCGQSRGRPGARVGRHGQPVLHRKSVFLQPGENLSCTGPRHGRAIGTALLTGRKVNMASTSTQARRIQGAGRPMESSGSARSLRTKVRMRILMVLVRHRRGRNRGAALPLFHLAGSPPTTLRSMAISIRSVRASRATWFALRWMTISYVASRHRTRAARPEGLPGRRRECQGDFGQRSSQRRGPADERSHHFRQHFQPALHRPSRHRQRQRRPRWRTEGL